MGKTLQQNHPEVVILELGANDGLRGAPVQLAESNLSAMIQLAQHAKAKVLLLGIQLPPNYGPDYTKRFRAIYPKLAKKHNVALVPFMLAGVPPEQFQADNLHPNEAGQAQILNNVLPSLTPLLR